jgi:hypothetical protein
MILHLQIFSVLVGTNEFVRICEDRGLSDVMAERILALQEMFNHIQKDYLPIKHQLTSEMLGCVQHEFGGPTKTFHLWK